MSRRLQLRCALFALLCTSCLVLWQALLVHYNFDGNWTALFFTGSLLKGVPTELKSEHIYILQNSGGYDAQFYHYAAHDPFLRRGFVRYFDDARFRYRRILVPLLAFLMAFGQDGVIDAAYFIVVWTFIFLGAYWLARLAVRHGYPAWFGLFFTAAPAVLVSTERLTVDIALAACSAGFALYVEERAPYKLYAVLAAAGLSRETGLLLPAAYAIYLARERRFREAAAFSTSVLPTLGWYLFLNARTRGHDPEILSLTLFSGLFGRILHPFPYPFGGFIKLLAIALDLLALAGIVAALAWAVYRAFQRTWTPVTVAIYLFALLVIAASHPGVWSEVYAFGRSFTPLVLLASLDGLSVGSALPAVAMLALDPRIGLQMGGQIVNVVRGLITAA